MVFQNNKSALLALLFAAMLCSLQTTAQNNPYRRPPADVAAIVEAKPTPQVSVSPTRDALLLTDYNPNPGIATLAQPFLKLAGQRVNPQINARQRITEYTGCTVQWFSEGKNIAIALPSIGRLAVLVARWQTPRFCGGRRTTLGGRHPLRKKQANRQFAPKRCAGHTILLA